MATLQQSTKFMLNHIHTTQYANLEVKVQMHQMTIATALCIVMAVELKVLLFALLHFYWTKLSSCQGSMCTVGKRKEQDLIIVCHE